jgi:hypothetical protein
MAMTESADRRVVCCVKWGSKFDASYVNRLSRAARANMSTPCDVVCITDDPTGLDADIEAVPFPDFGPPPDRWKHRGTWAKVAMFSPEVFEPDTMVLYLDLDVLVLGPLDGIFNLAAEKGGFHYLREWNPTLVRALPLALRPDRGGQGSIFCWRAREQYHIAAHFKHNWRMVQDTSWGERSYHGRIAWRPQYLPYNTAASFKRHCLGYTPFGLGTVTARKPDWASLVVFHGPPNPSDLVAEGTYRWGTRRRRGAGPVPWIQDYFKRYG